MLFSIFLFILHVSINDTVRVDENVRFYFRLIVRQHERVNGNKNHTFFFLIKSTHF